MPPKKTDLTPSQQAGSLYMAYLAKTSLQAGLDLSYQYELQPEISAKDEI